MGRTQFLETVAALCAGLQVPVSIDRRMLGAAYAPWSRLHNLGHSFGWRDSASYLAAFKRYVDLDG